MARVHTFPGVLRGANVLGTTVRNATPVRGAGQWYEWANAAVWLAGRGGQLLSFGPNTDLASSTGFVCYTRPHEQILNWLWVLSLARTSASANVYGHFTGAQGTTIGEWQLDSSIPIHTTQHFFFTEKFSSISSPYAFTAVLYIDSASDNVDLSSLSCSELPMHSITEFGGGTALIEPETCATNRPIFEPASGIKSVNGLSVLVADPAYLTAEAKRPLLFSWCHPSGVSTGSSSYASMGTWESPPSVVARHLYNGSNSRSVQVAVRAAVAGAPNTGNVKITAESGGTCTLNITSGTAAWYTGTLTVETEDLSRNDDDGGLRGASRETLAVEGRVTGGSTTLVVTGIDVMDG